MRRKGISAVLWENPTKNASNIHPDVFNSFYQTVTYEQSHKIIYEEILRSMVTPFFRIWTSKQKPPKQVHVISPTHHPTIPLPATPSPPPTIT